MTLAWGWPLALAGFAALLVPVLLHLDRRRSVQTLRFAALRWVLAQARPRRTWRLVEWLLLGVRLALVAALVAWLAQPSLRGVPHAPVHWIAVVPGAQAPAAGESTVWLADGFPPLTQPLPTTATSTSSLLRELDARLPANDTLEVRVPRVMSRLDAASIDLSRAVIWTVGGDASPPATPVPARPKLALRVASEDVPAVPYVRAAIAAWQPTPALAVTLDEALLDAPVAGDVDAVLRIESAPASSVDADTAESFLANHPVDRARRGRVITLPALDASLVQSAAFPRWLHRAVFGDPPPPDRAPATAIEPTATAAAHAPVAQPLQRWLAALAALLFLLERLLATGRRLRGGA